MTCPSCQSDKEACTCPQLGKEELLRLELEALTKERETIEQRIDAIRIRTYYILKELKLPV